ncbi:hypothetical protein A7D35_02855 [Xanthomonas arboricola]|nr:hypothetical protein A7D35_02855 [Xanthomonas arboricola]
MLAHRTSKRATEIADRAAQIAQQQHDEAVNMRAANARIVGRLLLNEISELPQRLHLIHLMSGRLTLRIHGQQRLSFAVNNIEQALEESRRPLLPGAEKSESRIHTLPDRLGDDLATLIGYSRTLNATSDALLEDLRVLTNNQPSEVVQRIYEGRASAINSFRGYVAMACNQSIQVANDFRRFVGLPPYDYSKFVIDED